VGIDYTGLERWYFVTVPTVEHGVFEEKQRGEEGEVGEAEGEAEEVDVEQGEVQEEGPREETDGLQRANTHHREDLGTPDHGYDQEGEDLVREELEEEEQDTDHNGDEDQGLDHVGEYERGVR